MAFEIQEHFWISGSKVSHVAFLYLDHLVLEKLSLDLLFAESSHTSFYKLNGPEIVSKSVAEPKKKIRNIFQAVGDSLQQ